MKEGSTIFAMKLFELVWFKLVRRTDVKTSVFLFNFKTSIFSL